MKSRATIVASIAIGFSADAAIGAVLSNFIVGFAIGRGHRAGTHFCLAGPPDYS